MIKSDCGTGSHFELAFIIVKRGLADKALKVAHRAGAIGGNTFLGIGTAKSHLLDMLGIEKEHYYEIILITIPKVKLNFVMKEISIAMKLSQPGKGIMFSLPTLGCAGLNILQQLFTEKGISLPEYQPVYKEEIKNMSDKEFALIVSITNRGYADDAMDAARHAGAEGGIIIHGRGGGFEKAESFFGIKIEHEREILLNLVDKSKVNSILRAIVDKTGIKTPARGISFVMPVSQATGVVRLDDVN